MAILRHHKDKTYTHLQYDDRQLFDRLQSCSHSISIFSQVLSEKNLIIHNLQENFSRERTAMSYEISTLKWQLAVEKQNVKIAAQKRETSNSEEACQDDGAETTKPKVGPEPAEEWRPESLEAEHHKAQHQALQPELEPELEPEPELELESKSKPHQRDHVKVLVQRRAKRPVSPSPPAAETESWQSARETVSPSVEHAPQQRQVQGQVGRKRKRALRGGDCS